MNPFNSEMPINNLHFIVVSRQEVETKNISRLVKSLKALDEIGNACGTVCFSFDGYNHDVREIFEIMEIRQWVKIAFHKIPHLLYYCERNMQEGINNMLTLLLEGSHIQKGEKVNAYEAVARGLHKQESILSILTLNNKKWSNMAKEIRKHALKHNTSLDAELTIQKVESIFEKK